MKFKYINTKWKFQFANGHHHHYHCCLTISPTVKYKIKNIKNWDELKRLNCLIYEKTLTNEESIEKKVLQKKLKSRYSFIKTHSIYYPELSMLYKMSRNGMDIESNEENEEESDNN